MSDVTARSSINLTKNQCKAEGEPSLTVPTHHSGDSGYGSRLEHSPFLRHVNRLSKQRHCELPAKGTGRPNKGRGTKNKDSPL